MYKSNENLTRPRLTKRRQRSARGLAITALMSIVAVFIIGPLSMFVYEMSMYNLCHAQLKACVDAAALCAACSTTASNSSDPATTQKTAMDQAAYMFAQNSILDQSLASTPAYTYGTGNPTWTPVANQAQLYFQFLDPVTQTPVAFGSANGKIMRVYGSFGFVPVFSKFIGLGQGPYLAVETSDGGLPLLDVVLCFDISASMDDFTNVSLVNRYLDSTTGKNGYSLPTIKTVNSQQTVQGPLAYALGGTYPLGLSGNATYPMDINSQGGTGNVEGIYYFNITGHGTHTGVKAPQNKATMDAYKSGLSFSECVVNLDGTATESSGITINGLTFPADDATTHKGLGVLVEAMRGNLESKSVADAAGVPYSTWGITPQAGYFAAYYQGAMSAKKGFPDANVSVPLRHPIGDAIVAAQSFFGVLSNDADVHFGLVTFGNNAGTKNSPTDSAHSGSYYVGSYAALCGGGPATSPYPTEPVQPINPTIYLNPTAGPDYSNYSGTSNAPITSVDGALFATTSAASPNNFSTVVAEGGTNIQDALDMALAMQLGTKTSDAASTPNGRSAMKLGRAGATRAIVLFTDGLPNGGGDSGTNDPKSQALAKAAAKAGIPIYTIGLCLNPSLQANQTTVLSDATGSTGIAALSGNGATFTQTTSASELNAVFQNVARQLVQLVR